MSIYDYSLERQDGSSYSLAENKGKVMLIVNTATKCGFTPQYKELEEMYEKYHERGLEIIDVPCNQFASQAPGSDEEITQFCTLHYNTRFPQMKKADVNGENELPLYTFLKEKAAFGGFGKGLKAKIMNLSTKLMNKGGKDSDIRWNFTKFVVDREGNVVARFEPTDDMAKVEECAEALL